MCKFFNLEANWFQLYKDANDVTDFKNENGLDIFSKFYSKSGFEPTIQLRIREFPQSIWSPRHTAAR